MHLAGKSRRLVRAAGSKGSNCDKSEEDRSCNDLHSLASSILGAERGARRQGRDRGNDTVSVPALFRYLPARRGSNLNLSSFHFEEQVSFRSRFRRLVVWQCLARLQYLSLDQGRHVYTAAANGSHVHSRVLGVCSSGKGLPWALSHAKSHKKTA